MNANELAKGLEVFGKWVGGEHKLLNEAATMLRHQQAEIEALKEQTTNLQELTLTNDDIKEVIKSLKDSIYFDEKLGFFELKEFAEAILRKVQEK